MKRKEKDAIMDKLLYITILSIISSVTLWFIYKGYRNTRYILAMPYIIATLGLISIIITSSLGWKIYKNRKTFKKLIAYLIACGIATIGFILIYPYNVKYIYILWWIIAANLIITFTFNIYKISIKK